MPGVHWLLGLKNITDQLSGSCMFTLLFKFVAPPPPFFFFLFRVIDQQLDEREDSFFSVLRLVTLRTSSISS